MANFNTANRDKDLYADRKAQIFVSYRSQDLSLATNVVDVLHDSSVEKAASIWFDLNLTPSQEWNENIIHKINHSQIILVLLSSSYLESDYCMSTELPLIRKLQKENKSVVKVIKLDNCQIGEAFDCFEIWPDEKLSVVELDEKSRQWPDLIIWLKVEISKALVARHRDKYNGRSREEKIRALGSGYNWNRKETTDDLDYLHSAIGEKIFNRSRRLLWVIVAGAVWGAFCTTLISYFFFSGGIHSFLSSLVFSVSVGCCLGLIDPVFREIEKWIHGRIEADLKFIFNTILVFISLGAIAGAIRYGILGLIIGVFIQFFEWHIAIGLIGTVIIGLLLGLLEGFILVVSFTEKKIKIFHDVRDVYKPPERTPIEFENNVVNFKATEFEVSDDKEELSNVKEGSDELAVELDQDITQETFFKATDRTIEDIPVKLIIVGASERPNETQTLLNYLNLDFAKDLFKVMVANLDQKGVDDPIFWHERLAITSKQNNRIYCLILITKEFLNSAVSRALAECLSSREYDELKVYPILVDQNLEMTTELMMYQGLPKGKLAIKDWSIHENAWVNVVVNVAESAKSSFLLRLDYFIEEMALKKYQKSTRNFGFPNGFESLKVIGSVIDKAYLFPKRLFQLYPFTSRRYFWSWKKCFTWMVNFSLIIGIVFSFFYSEEPFNIGVPLSISIVGIVLVMFFLGKTDIFESKQLCNGNKGIKGYTLSQFIADDPYNRRLVILRIATILIKPLLLIAACSLIVVTYADEIINGLISSKLWMLSSFVFGALLGGACYLSSRYYVPAILFTPEAPSPASTKVTRIGSTWWINVPNEDPSDTKRSKIGKKKSPQPKIISNSNLGLSFSFGELLISILEALGTSFIGLAVFLGLLRSGIEDIFSLFLAIWIVSVSIKWVLMRKSYYVVKGESKFKAYWLQFINQVLLPSIRLFINYMYVVIVCLLGSVFLFGATKTESLVYIIVGVTLYTIINRTIGRIVSTRNKKVK